jgi:hypothetical protein
MLKALHMLLVALALAACTPSLATPAENDWAAFCKANPGRGTCP